MPTSRDLYAQARKLMPGGVSSPVRAFDPYPRYIARGEGARVWDVDGRAYIDHCLAFGPLILGHAHPHVADAIARQAREGWNFGAPTEAEVRLAERIAAWVPGVDALRLVNSGTEATMHAIRLARGATGRSGVVKVEGAFHGAHDAVLVNAGSGVATHGIPGTDGVPHDVARHTRVVPFNDADALAGLVEAQADELACVILEPVLGNVGTIPPEPGYLEAVRKVTRDNGVLLIFDEVITGFRLGKGGAQERYGVTPDLTTLGKVAGGGLPLGVFGGRSDLMEKVSPQGPIYQAGTFSGNPHTCAAGLATLDALEKAGWSGMEKRGEALRRGLADAAADAGAPHAVTGVGSMFSLYFTHGPVTNSGEAKAGDADLFWRYFREMLELGVYLAPSPYETGFLSTAHGDHEVDAVVEAAAAALERATNA